MFISLLLKLGLNLHQFNEKTLTEFNSENDRILLSVTQIIVNTSYHSIQAQDKSYTNRGKKNPTLGLALEIARSKYAVASAG